MEKWPKRDLTLSKRAKIMEYYAKNEVIIYWINFASYLFRANH